jgi:hypothetical protein
LALTGAPLPVRELEAKNERKGELMLEILDLIEWALNIVWGD